MKKIEDFQKGDTVRLGTSKTAVTWEVISINEQRQDLWLSKLGGTGYVNKTAKPEQVKEHEVCALEIPLYKVLEKQEEVRSRFSSANESARRLIYGLDGLEENAKRALHAVWQLDLRVHMHCQGLKEYFPDLPNDFLKEK